MKPPNRIFLQIEHEFMSDYLEEGITWCADRINDTDAEYVLAARVEEMEAAINSALAQTYDEIVAATLRDSATFEAYQDSWQIVARAFTVEGLMKVDPVEDAPESP